MSTSLGLVSVTVKRPLTGPFSAPLLVAAIETSDVSLSVIVPLPCASLKVTSRPDARMLERLMKNVSSAVSTSVSPLTVISMVFVSPFVPVKLSVPEFES